MTQTTPGASLAADVLRSERAESLWASLQADGFEVEVRDHDQLVTVQVREGSAACPDCLVPAGVLQNIVTSFLEGEGALADGVEVAVELPRHAEAGEGAR
jgi:hypothetical protein